MNRMDPTQTCYLFLDFDGTVYLDGAIPPENRAALRAVQRMGHQVILNTGRARGGLNLAAEQYQGVDWDGVIFGSSDMTYRGIRYHEHTLSEDEVLHWVRYGMDRHYWITLGGETEPKPLRFQEHPEDFTSEETDAILNGIREWMGGVPVTKLSIQNVDACDVPENGVTVVRMATYAEILPKGRDKGVAFLDFCERYAIPTEQCVCFGDSLNDLAVFRVCPNSVAMKHSPEELRQCATYIAGGEIGVAEGVAHYFGKIWT